jgi:hypothetical protein
MTSRRFPLRRVLVIALVVVAVFAAVGVWGVYRPLHTRGPGVVTASAANFTLPDTTGKPVALASLLDRGPAVVVFYRGFW